MRAVGLGRLFLLSGSLGEEVLDRPQSNFDVAGVPTGSWSSNLFACYENLVPSCVLSFCCPCIMWAQVVVRAQIPLLIGMKNSSRFMRRTSGYSCFVNTFLVLAILIAGFFLLAYLAPDIPRSVRLLFWFLFAFTALLFVWMNGHLRTAFKHKYSISPLLKGCAFWDCLFDAFVGTVCFPCSLAQMARHVFQYDRWDPPIGLYLEDPYALDALEAQPDRPQIADNAGLFWGNDARHPDVVQHTGRADREWEQLRNSNNSNNDPAGGAPGSGPAKAVAVPSAPPVLRVESQDQQQEQQPSKLGRHMPRPSAPPVAVDHGSYDSGSVVYDMYGKPVNNR